jgi:hypothetical protein
MIPSESTAASGAEHAEPASPSARQVSGRLVVVGMFAFGILLTASLYIYWDFHTRPFRPLQDAIAAEFPEYTPRVIGGRHKSHRAAAPNTLRMILLVDFNPREEPAGAKTEAIASKLAELAGKHHDVSQYDILEIHLVHRVPEREDESWSRSATPAEWAEATGPATASSPPT